MVNNVIRRFFILIKNLLGWLRNMNVPSLSFFFKFIRDHDIRSIYVVSYNLCANNSTNDSPCVDTNTHVQLWEIELFPHQLDMLNHCQSHIYNILSLLQKISLIAICKSKNNIAVTNGVNFVDIIFQTLFVKLLEQFS